MATDLKAAVKACQQDLIGRRRHFHARPELSFQEVETARVIENHLRQWGYEVQAGVAKTGLLATLKGGKPGRGVLVRADMDGLPLQEDSELAFRSTTPNVMHACGHDVHLAVALTLAELLAQSKPELPGTVRFAFQPAEETAGGALPMIEAGALDGIDRVIGLHVWSGLPTGTVSVRSGPIMASADWISIVLHGKGGHGAMPHLTVDPIVIAAQVVSTLQTLVSRETPPSAAAVLTIGSIHGGSAHNIVAEQVELHGTLRTFDAALRLSLLQRIGEVAAQVARAMRGDADLKLESGAPPVVNDSAMAALVTEEAAAVVGAERVVPFEPLMVGEDFSYFLEQRPGCFFLLGGAPPDGPRVHHTSTFAVDEACLPIGLEVMGRAVLRMLEI